jgi:class 3 adenylate cyclase
VRAALRERFAAIAPLAAYGSAACGADLLCLEAALEAGCETHIVLPFPAADFRRSSVDFAGGDWGERFERALAAADSVTVTSDHHARGSSATFDYANLVLTGMGRLRAQMLDTSLRALAVRDPADAGRAGGTTSNLALWSRNAIPVDEIRLDLLRGKAAPRSSEPAATEPQPSAVARHEMRAMLFADAVGYSKLSEDQIPGYIAGFLGAVADLSRRTAHRFEHVETSGDGLYMVFRDPIDAAHYALELSAMVNRFDRAAWGLPPDFNLRVALHCGPVHCAVDPITGSPLYTGPHTSRAARIEPVTPPGQVYASSAFAAVAAAIGNAFAMTYVGRMPLAKGYGSLGLYHLRGAG